MKKRKTFLLLLTLIAFTFSGCGILRTLGIYRPRLTTSEKISEFKSEVIAKKFTFELPPRTRIDTVNVDLVEKVVEIHFNDAFAAMPYRNDNVREVYRQVQTFFAEYFEGYTFSIQALRRPLEQLVPNYFRTDTSQFDKTRLPVARADRPLPVVRNISKPFEPSKGLQNRNIGVWNSHGWYYNRELDRWEWQRPRLFMMVEDLIPTSFVLPYLVPMLENAGANVFLPRERDVQTNEAMVDNDSPSSGYSEISQPAVRWESGSGSGFAVGAPPYGPGVNPLTQGTFRIIRSEQSATAGAAWVPQIPESGEYAVYISYKSSDSSIVDAHYAVHHLGGKTEFVVNQRIGGGTWIYLGTFKFTAGRNRASGSVVLSNESQGPMGFVTADGVRFGGGMGIIARNGRTSGRPRYAEGSRYYLQFAGMPDTIVYNFTSDKDDYRDDYQSRPEYLNYLTGAPYGPNRKRDEKGLGIPIDLSMAFHTDAGITHNDTTIGTLSIYSIPDAKRSNVFPDSVSRFANRDLADLVQTQIVNDVRSKYDPAWQRRQLMNSSYAEAVRPNMPSLLLELLSHQNYLDMKFVLDPRFRFDVARSIYKGMLRFLATERQEPYVVQPLPVTHFSAELDADGNAILNWKMRPDSLEPTAVPNRYVVYTRLDDGGFDNGVVVDTLPMVVKKLKPGVIYSFKVTAVNDGGESFPSEILAVCSQPHEGTRALIVNGFHRVAGPGTVEAGEYEGFVSSHDRGVPDHYELGITGEQFDFDRSSAFRSNDGPGHGASFSDNETKVVAGNSFDYPYTHGRALKSCGLSFCSASSDAVMDSIINLGDYRFVDLILGKEKETPWPKQIADSARRVQFRTFPLALQNALRRYSEGGGKLFVSGSYIGTDLFSHPKEDSASIRFAWNILHFDWSVGHATRSGLVYSTDSAFFPNDRPFAFNSELSRDVYSVESPDAIVPSHGGRQLLRYAGNQFGAAIGYNKDYGVVAMGFPFETILKRDLRVELMHGVLKYLGVLAQ
ncbi:MAG: N-acetylmuramoyl-L-alanine amidase [Ignavibacteriales bacterium]|nr:N-acetylmuramoyl-L-alanine amidase [Ignavibacteriales bacterium]